MATDPVYFELSWSILSTIGAANVFFGLLVISVTNFSPVAAVPLVTSTAGSVANGLCYYAFYSTSPPVTNRAVASAFADMLWVVQEAGLSFYSYMILSRILQGKQWYIFASLFWTFIMALLAVRIMIAVTRVRSIIGSTTGLHLQETVNHLHMAYFPLMAVLECVSAYYLLTTFANAKFASFKRASKRDLLQYLMRSTEVRLALLALVGVMRAVTYSFQASMQRATHIASQVDRFAYTLECLFPIVMYIDMLSSKIIYTNQRYNVSLQSQQARPFRGTSSGGGKDDPTYPPSRGDVEELDIVAAHGGGGGGGRYGMATDFERGTTSQQTRIVRRERAAFGMAASDVDLVAMDARRVGTTTASGSKAQAVGVEVEVAVARVEAGVGIDTSSPSSPSSASAP